jgi:hypothetical protein
MSIMATKQSTGDVDPCSPEKVKELIKARQDMVLKGILPGTAGLGNIIYDPKGAVEENALNKTPTEPAEVVCKFLNNLAGKGTQVCLNHLESKPGEVPVPEDKGKAPLKQIDLKIDLKGI